MLIPLEIKYRDEPLRETTAWYLPSGSVDEWMNVIFLAGWDQSKLRFISLSSSEGDRTSCGVLFFNVAKNGNESNPQKGSLDSRLQPYGLLKDGVYVPIQARINAALSQDELDDIFDDDEYIYIWHPVHGLTGSENRDALSVENLFKSPEISNENWSHAVAGQFLNYRIRSLRPSVKLTMDQFAQLSRDDIGQQSNELLTLPRSPEEAGDGFVERIRRQIGLAFSKMMSVSGQSAPATTTKAPVVISSLLFLLFVMILVGAAIGLLSNLLHTKGDIGDKLLKLLTFVLAILFIVGIAMLLGRLLQKLTGINFGVNTATRNSGSGSSQSRNGSSGSGAFSPGGFLSQLRTWASNYQANVQSSLDAARNKEVSRLLNLLEKNPDEGLRYALPMQGDAHRGIGAAGWQLTTRDVDFQLSSLGGGQAADFWNLDYQWRHKLMNQYRQCAQREIALGRYRRAAYVFAELMGDFSAAASTLADGGHFREAAVLYKDRLRQPRQAADCLRRGGLPTEAIEIYKELKMYEVVGDIYTELEQPIDAIESYELELKRHMHEDNCLAAAKLSEDKLHSPKRAFEFLDRGWPNSTQANTCVTESFKFLARQGWHDQGIDHAQSILSRSPSIHLQQQLTTLFSHAATTYPDRAVASHLADQTRIMAANCLTDFESRSSRDNEATRKLMNALESLAPQEKLLERDTRRYRDSIAPGTKKPLLIEHKRATSGKVAFIRHCVSPILNSRKAISIGKVVYLAGYRNNELLIVRGNENGNWHYPGQKPWQILTTKSPLILAGDPQESGKVIVHAVNNQPLTRDRTFPKTDDFNATVNAGSFRGLNQNTIAAAYNTSCQVYCVEINHEQEIQINVYAGNTGPLLKTLAFAIPNSLDFPDDRDVPEQYPFAVRQRHWYLALENVLMIGDADGLIDTTNMNQPIRDLMVSGPNTLYRLIAVLNNGVWMQWGYESEKHQAIYAEELTKPVACLGKDGELIVVGENGIQVYKNGPKGYVLESQSQEKTSTPISVFTLKAKKEFYVISDQGGMSTYRW